MSEVIGDNPGGPDEVFGHTVYRLGSVAGLFIGELTGTTERRERLFAAFFHPHGGERDYEEHIGDIYDQTGHLPEDMVGLLGMLRVIQGTTSAPRATVEAWAGGKRMSVVLPPSRPFDIRTIDQSKQAVMDTLTSPRIRVLSGAVAIGAVAGVAFARLRAEHNNRLRRSQSPEE